MTNDPINPNHYRQGKIECIDAIEAATVGKTGIEAACVANITKYLWRYEAKNGLQDVLKAKWYLDKLVDVLSSQEGFDNDGWIEWHGGECPVDHDAIVEVKLKDCYGTMFGANRLIWQHHGNDGDIIAYRIVKE